MANPYTPPPALSGYNATPPSDDGQQTTSNQLEWQKLLDKVGDPLKTFVEELETNVNTAFATVDSATNLTQGTIPEARLGNPDASILSGELADARLSANVPIIDSGTFTPTWTGFSADPTGVLNYEKIGNHVMIWATADRLGTSDATTFTLGNLPASIRPPGNRTVVAHELEDNGAVAWGQAQVSAAGNITFGKNSHTAFGGFTASGSKGIQTAFVIVYPSA